MKQASKQKFTLNQPHPFLIKPNKKSCSNPRRSCFLTTTLSTLRSQFSYSANNPFTTSPCSDPSSPTLSSDTYPSSTKIPRSGASSEISLALSLYTTSLRLQYSFFGTRNSIGSGTPDQHWHVSQPHLPSQHSSVPFPESFCSLHSY